MRACSWLGLAIARRLGPVPRDRARCSDACAAEHLAGILARESGMLERIRTGGSDTGSEQPIIALARVHVHRPVAAAVVADYASGASQRDREIPAAAHASPSIGAGVRDFT